MSDVPSITITDPTTAIQAPEPTAPAPPPAAPEPILSDYAQQVLNAVPEAERGVVGKYISQWDAGVSRRASELERTYGPLVDLVNNGYEVEDLSTAAQLYDALNTNYEAAIEAIQKAWGSQEGQPAPTGGGAPVEGQVIAQLPPEVIQQLSRSNQFMEQLALRDQERAQQQEIEQEHEALNEYMAFLKQEKGDFDETFVLTRMSMGVDGAIAVDEFNNMFQQRLEAQGGQSRLPAPPVLTGGSAVTGAKPIHQASNEERKAAVMAIVQQANKQAY